MGIEAPGDERTDQQAPAPRGRPLPHWRSHDDEAERRAWSPRRLARSVLDAVRTSRALAVALLLLLATAANIAYDWYGPLRFYSHPVSDFSSAPSPESWPMLGRAPDRNAYDPDGALADSPEVVWRFDLGSRLSSSPVVHEGRLFVAGESGRAVRLDARTGKPVWEHDLGAAVRASPAAAGGVVVFSTLDGSATALDASTGEPMWRYAFEEQSLSPPAIFEGVVYVGSNDWHIYALDVQTGELRWRYKALDSVRSGPSVNDEAVVFTDVTNRLYTLRRDTGTFRMDFKTAGPARGGVVLQDTLGYVADRGGRVRAVDWTVRDLPFEKAYLKIRVQLFAWKMISEPPEIKGSVWYFRKRGEEYSATPVAAHDAVYAVALSGAVIALDKEDGSLLWEARIDRGVPGSPIVVGRTLVVGDAIGVLYGLDALSGAELWKVRLVGGLVGAPAFASGTLFAASASGEVYALR